MWSSKYVSGISMFYMFICGDILQTVVETEIWKYYIISLLIILILGDLLKTRKLIPWSNIWTFQTFLEHFPRCVYLTKFHPESLSHKLFSSCFLVSNKTHLKSKDTISAFIAFSLFSKVKLDQMFSCFAWWDYCLPDHVRPHLICETWPQKTGEY